MEDRRLSRDEIFIMSILWKDRQVSSLGYLTDVLNKKYSFGWKNPMTALVLGRLIRWGYADIRNTESGKEIIALVSQQEYAEMQIRYSRMRRTLFDAAFSKENPLELEEVTHLRDLIDQLE